MSDVGWGSDHLEPPKKRKIPLWVLGCGGGCMFAIGAIIVASLVVGPKVRRWVETLTQPEVQWPRLAEALPFDQRPSDVTIKRFPWPIVEIWRLEIPAKDLFVFVCAAPPGNGEGPWGKWLLDPKLSPMFANQEGTFESLEGTLVVQGRELSSVRFTRNGVPAPANAETSKPTDPAESESATAQIDRLFGSDAVHGSGLDLDVTPEDSPRRVLVWLVRGEAGATVSDDEARAFLAMFKIGPQR